LQDVRHRGPGTRRFMISVTEIPALEIAPGYDGFAALASPGEEVGLLILSEMFGVTAAMKDAARDFARAGISTLVPNIFRRSSETGVFSYEGKDRERAQIRADNLKPDAVCEDIELAIKAFRTRVPELRQVAALGHCIGGGFAATALTKTSLAAAISYYGFGISNLGGALAQLGKPAQLHYGLADPHIPLSEIEAVRTCASGNSRIEIFEYPEAGHSFCNPHRPMFDKAQAQLARDRALSLLRNLNR